MTEVELIEEQVEKIEKIARDFGLDFFPINFEILPSDVLYSMAAFSGMPTKYQHWTAGKSFQRQKASYDYGMSKIYEMIINSDPCYAFLLEGNDLLQNKLIIAHCFAHNDFFKNNATFAHTSRGMVESMAISAKRIKEFEFKYGVKEVEVFIDSVLAIQYNVDSRNHIAKKPKKTKEIIEKVNPYDDLFNLGVEKVETKIEDEKEDVFDRDLIRFIDKYSTVLKPWQKEILNIVRADMLYFFPQIETKIANEGWASFWHDRIMRELDLTPDEVIDFASLHSGVVQPGKTSLNPYFLGYKIWEDIEKRLGREAMFEIRANETDVSFIRNYLTDELIRDLDLYVFEKRDAVWKITEKDFEEVRNNLVLGLVNGGLPFIFAKDNNYNNNGELLLVHQHEGLDLDYNYFKKTLEHVYKLWGKNVALETIMDSKKIIYVYNGIEIIKRFY